MGSLLDAFLIGFQSEGIQDFEKNLKTTESELDKAEKKVTALEKELAQLEKSSDKDTKAIERVKLSLINARAEVVKFQKQVDVMHGRSEYQITKLKKNFQSLVKSVALLASVGVAVRQSLQLYEQAEQLDFLAQKSNVAVESLQRLGLAAQRYGGTTEGTASVVEQFTTKEFKEKALSVGVSVAKDNPEQTLENIAAKMEQLKTDAQKWELAKSLGLDEGTARLLIGGVERYREELKRANKYKLYTKEDIERMRDFRQVQQDIRMGVQNIQLAIARFLLPALTNIAKFIRAITDWAASHEGAIKIVTLFVSIAAAVAAVTTAVSFLSKALTLLLVHPVVLTIAAVIAGITAIIALFQDLVVFFEGGESVVGRFFDRIGVGAENAKRVLDELLDKLGAVLRLAGNLPGLSGLRLIDSAHEYANSKGKFNPHANPWSFGGIEYLYSAFRVAKQAKNAVEKANNNKLNSVSQNSISNYNQTEALTSNNNANTKTIANNTTKNVNVNIGTITTQAKDGKELAGQLSTVADMDNGFAA